MDTDEDEDKAKQAEDKPCLIGYNSFRIARRHTSTIICCNGHEIH